MAACLHPMLSLPLHAKGEGTPPETSTLTNSYFFQLVSEYGKGAELMRSKVMVHAVLIVSSVLLYGFAATVHAEDYRIGVVNALKVLEQAPQAEEARKRLEEEFAERDRKLVATQKELKSKEDKLAQDGAIMSESERSRLEREIINARRDLKRDQDEFREDLNFRRNEEFGKIQRLVVEAIQSEGAAQKFDIILGEGVIYASGKVDITDKVVDRLKKKASAGE